MVTESTPVRLLPPGTEAMFSAKCKDVVMGRGSGTQNHCGNVAYRKLVYLNKELYVTSSKFDKLKISKAIVAAVRHFGGNFIQADELRGGQYFDIGDKRAWDKTSQALREGQAGVREKLAKDDPAGMSKIAELKKVISEEAFFAYACKIMESLFYSGSESGENGISACGPECPYAKRRQTLHQLGVYPQQIFNAMCSVASPQVSHLQPQITPQQPQHQVYNLDPHYDSSTYNNHTGPSSSMLYEPLPFIAPASEAGFESLDPLPYKPQLELLNPIPYPPSNVTEVSLEPIPHQMENYSEKFTSSISSLNEILNQFDFEASSEEGRELMAALNQEIDDLIRRKSLGLIQIDTKYAFEDLIFDADDEMPVESAPRYDSNNLKSTGWMPPKSGTGGFGYSMMSAKDDMSLMNMSLLSLEDHGGSETPKRIKDGRPSKSTGTKRKDSRVSWSREQQSSFGSSIMSWDNRSFSDLVECIKDTETNQVEDNNTPRSSISSSHSQGSISRRMGFPIRRSVAGKILGESNTLMDIRREEFEATSKAAAGVLQKESEAVSSSTVPEDLVVESDAHFTKVAGHVHNPLESSAHTMKNISQYSMSNMTLSMTSLGVSFRDLLDEDE